MAADEEEETTYRHNSFKTRILFSLRSPAPNLKAVKLFNSSFNYYKADLQQEHAEHASV